MAKKEIIEIVEENKKTWQEKVIADLNKIASLVYNPEALEINKKD